MKRPLNDMLMSVGGIGYMRPASGTWGSMPPVILAGLMLMLGTPVWIYTVVIVVVGVLSCVICAALGEWSEKHYGRTDPGQVVIDEVAGQCVALLLPPIALLGEPMTIDWFLHTGAYLGACFVLFRIFDIIKPPPANQLQKLRAGWGILLDDLVAGAMALVLVQGAIVLIT